MSRNKKIILAATFLALLVVLSRFLSVKTPIMKISFAFVPTMLCATYLGWKWSVLVNVLGDLIGALLFPTGPFFLGYTISTAVAGLIYGLFLYQAKPRKKSAQWKFALQVTLAVILVAVIVNMGLNTLWTSITVGKAFWPLFFTRITKQLIMIPVHIVVFLMIEKVLQIPAHKYLYDDNDEDDNDQSNELAVQV